MGEPREDKTRSYVFHKDEDAGERTIELKTTSSEQNEEILKMIAKEFGEQGDDQGQNVIKRTVVYKTTTSTHEQMQFEIVQRDGKTVRIERDEEGNIRKEEVVETPIDGVISEVVDVTRVEEEQQLKTGILFEQVSDH